MEKLLSEIKDEQKGTSCFATYVVLPHSGDSPFNGRYLVIAPRRSEHVSAAKGNDVLAAGEIAINQENVTVEYLDNNSGRYLPGRTSIKWVKKTLEQAEIPCPMKEFSALYPDGGDFTENS